MDAIEMTEDPIVEVKNMYSGYGDRIILENISLKVRRGEIFLIVGASGCGKTTLLKNIIGLLPPISGDVLINGKSITRSEGDEKRSMMKQFGVLYQTGALFGSLTLAENVALPLEEFSELSQGKIKEKVDEKLRLVNLDGFQDYLPSALSGGMRKRAGLARAMALDPELLFFDEPSSGLDPLTAANLDLLILDLKKKFGTSMVIVSHELDSIFKIADRMVILDKEAKGIVAEGSPYELRDSPQSNPKVREFLDRKGLSRTMTRDELGSGICSGNPRFSCR